MSTYMRRRRLATERRYSSAAGEKYETHRPTVNAVVIGPNLAQVDGRLVDAAGLKGIQPGAVVSMQNVGSAGRALYMPRTGGAATSTGRSAGSASAPTAPGGTVGVHDLDGASHRGTLARYQAPWAAAITDLHDRQHDIIEPADHTATTGTPGDLIGVIAGPALAYQETSSDGAQDPGAVARFDANGDLAARYLQAQKITNDAGSLILDASVEILLDQTLKATTDIEGAPSLLLNPVTGLGDFTILQAQQAFFETIIAQAKRAEAGAIHVTKSLAEVAQAMTVPVAGTGASKGTAGELIVNDFESLPGWDNLGGNRDDHLVKLHFFSAGGTSITPVTRNSGKSASDTGDAAGSTVYTLLNFEAQAVGDPSPVMDWSGANNSTTIGSDSSPATVELDGSNRALFYDGGANNAHLHYRGAAQASIEADTGIVYTGRFKRSSAGEGIGLLVADRYPTDGTDEYVRIRCYGSTGGESSLNVDDHGQTVTPSGTTNSGYNPAANQWHRFRIEFDDGETTASTTTLRARFWADGGTEPSTWQIECEYTGAGRPTGGTVGIWYYQNTAGTWYDDLQIESFSGTASTNASATVAIPAGTKTDDYLIAFVVTTSTATVTKPTQFTLQNTSTADGHTARFYYLQWDGTTDPSEFTWSSNQTAEIHVAIYGIRNAASPPQCNFVPRSASETPSPTVTFSADAGDMDFVWHVRTDAPDLSGLSQPATYTRGGYATATNYEMVAHWRSITVDGDYLPSFTADEGDYIVAHVELYAAAGTSTAFAIGYAAGIVEKSLNQSGLDDGQTRYNFYTLPNQSNSEGRTIPEGSIALDYGTGPLVDKNADSYIEITTLDQAGSPYMRFMRLKTWTEAGKWYSGTAWNPTTASIYADRIMQLGELKGLTGFNSAGEIGLTIDSDDNRRQIFSTEQMVLDGPDSFWKDGSETYLTITRNDGIQIVTNTNDILDPVRAYEFVGPDGFSDGGLYNYANAALTSNQMFLISAGSTGLNALQLQAQSTDHAQARLIAIGGGGTGYVLVDSSTSSAESTIYNVANSIFLSADNISISANEINDWEDAGTLASGYTNGRALRAKRIGDLVFFTGRISKDDNNWTNGATVYTLDAEFRPVVTHYYRARLGVVGMNIVINTNGTIQTQEAVTNTNQLMFDGIFWTTATQ